MARRRRGGPRPDSVAGGVRRYIDARPVVRDALALGIVNLSALTRTILDETDLEGEEAVLVACRRYRPAAGGSELQKGILSVLSKSKLEVRTRIALLTYRPSWERFSLLQQAIGSLQGRSQVVHLIQGSDNLTVILDENLVEDVIAKVGPEGLLIRRTGLVEINVRSPDSIQDVPGILAFLASSLASRELNFVDVISCYKDNMFLIDQDDLFTAFEVLNGLIGAVP